MTSLLLWFKHRAPWLWRAVEWANGRLFGLRYPAFREQAAAVLAQHGAHGAFRFAPVTEADLAALSDFLTRQPERARRHFDPHGFDPATLQRLYRNRAFAMMQVTRQPEGEVVGYFFLRGFFVGRAFHGLLVDESAAGCGIGRTMWALSARICAAGGLKMYATVSQTNLPSLNSARRGTEVTVVETLANGYLLIACNVRPDDE